MHATERSMKPGYRRRINMGRIPFTRKGFPNRIGTVWDISEFRRAASCPTVFGLRGLDFKASALLAPDPQTAFRAETLVSRSCARNSQLRGCLHTVWRPVHRLQLENSSGKAKAHFLQQNKTNRLSEGATPELTELSDAAVFGLSQHGL